jgi:hypothetical protein
VLFVVHVGGDGTKFIQSGIALSFMNGVSRSLSSAGLAQVNECFTTLDYLLRQIGDDPKPALLIGVVRRQCAQSFLFLSDDRYLGAGQCQKCIVTA